MDASPTVGAEVLQREIRRQETRQINSKFLRAIGLPMDKIEAFERAKKPKGCLSRGMPNRRILVSKLIGNTRFEFHATKGWRRQREIG
jgi:hypothetical protein